MPCLTEAAIRDYFQFFNEVKRRRTMRPARAPGCYAPRHASCERRAVGRWGMVRPFEFFFFSQAQSAAGLMSTQTVGRPKIKKSENIYQ